MTALLQTHEPEHGGLDAPPARQEAVVLEERGFLLSQGRGDRETFVLGQHDAFEGAVERDVVVEGARVLRDGVEVPAEGAEGAAVDGVGVCYAVDFRTGGVDCMVDHLRYPVSMGSQPMCVTRDPAIINV